MGSDGASGRASGQGRCLDLDQRRATRPASREGRPLLSVQDQPGRRLAGVPEGEHLMPPFFDGADLTEANWLAGVVIAPEQGEAVSSLPRIAERATAKPAPHRCGG